MYYNTHRGRDMRRGVSDGRENRKRAERGAAHGSSDGWGLLGGPTVS